LDVSATCQTALIPRAPHRALIVLSPAAEHPEILALRLAQPASGETLNASVDAADSDADGRDDVRVSVSVGKEGSSEVASADVAWFDRAAGPSRNASEPANSLAKAAQALIARAKNKRLNASAVERINATRRLMSSLCGESSVSRVFDPEGNALRCGDIGRAIDQLAQAELSAALTRGDTLGAFSVFSRDGWYFRKFSDAARKSMEKELRKATSVVDVARATTSRARPKVGKFPQWSPLWFETDGALLIQTEQGVTRLSADGAREEPVDVDAGTIAWPLDVVSDSGARFLGAAYACDRSEVQLMFTEPNNGPPANPINTELMAPRPGVCKGGREFPPPTPIVYGHGAFQALIAGFLVSSTSPSAAQSLPQPGSARSQDGKWTVAASPLGIAVIGERKELWNLQALPAEQAEAAKLSHCIVSNAASAVACVQGGKAVLYLRS
jgi:hypothetical protein